MDYQYKRNRALNPLGGDIDTRESWIQNPAVPFCRRLVCASLIATLLAASQGAAQQSRTDFLQEPACQTLQPAATGGAMPKNPAVMVLRWLGAANHEIAYRGQVILLDAYYERTPPARPLGFTRADVNRADAIFIGHGHSDHLADGPFVAQRTGAPLIGARLTTAKAIEMGLPGKQTVTVAGGEIQQFKGFTVEAILARHSVRSPEFTRAADGAWRAMATATGLTRTPEDEQRERQIRVGVTDPRLADEGTIAYLFSFDDGLRLIYLDSSGPITEGEKKVMQRIGGRTDVAIVAYQGFYVAPRQIEATLPLVKLFHPRVFLPTHHDDTGGYFPDMAIYPLAMAIRDELPGSRSVSPLYRTPICFDTRTKEMYGGP